MAALSLKIEQQPRHALVASRKKGRKTIDPPPIIRLGMLYPDPIQLLNPSTFVRAHLVPLDDDHRKALKTALIGKTVSSLHRLYDEHNREGGFFIFEDLSCVLSGAFRLRFDLYYAHQHENGVTCHASVSSTIFQVVTRKAYEGDEPSTSLARTFANQGVRIRIYPRLVGPAPQPHFHIQKKRKAGRLAADSNDIAESSAVEPSTTLNSYFHQNAQNPPVAWWCGPDGNLLQSIALWPCEQRATGA